MPDVSELEIEGILIQINLKYFVSFVFLCLKSVETQVYQRGDTGHKNFKSRHKTQALKHCLQQNKQRSDKEMAEDTRLPGSQRTNFFVDQEIHPAIDAAELGLTPEDLPGADRANYYVSKEVIPIFLVDAEGKPTGGSGGGQGPEGPQGPQGIPGEPGAQGPQGETGPLARAIYYDFNVAATDTTQVNGTYLQLKNFEFDPATDSYFITRNSRFMIPGVDYVVEGQGIRGAQEITNPEDTSFFIRVTRRVGQIDPTISKGDIIETLGFTPARVEELTALEEKFDAQLDASNRETVLLTSGANSINAEETSLTDVEVYGRTLTSLGNSNLVAGKRYVLADPKTSIVTGGTTLAGVAKFTKEASFITAANFQGKVAGSLTANPHSAYRAGNQPELQPPGGILTEFGAGDTSTGYDRIMQRDSASASQNATVADRIPHHIFEFDLIAEVERRFGIIPKATVTEKVQWLKENVNRLVINWYGVGVGLGRNISLLSVWITTGSWASVSASNMHTQSIVTLISREITQAGRSTVITDDGKLYAIAYTDASDGVTGTTIRTDYVELSLGLLGTAQLDTRPTVIRRVNFEGKISESLVENPNRWRGVSGTVLAAPTSSHSELATDQIALGAKLDGVLQEVTTSSEGRLIQQLFSFDIIAEVERNIGTIPGTSVAAKVAWLKANLSSIVTNWYGYGNSVTGNKVTMARWTTSSGGQWSTTDIANISHTNSTVTRLNRASRTADLNVVIDATGQFHIAVFSDPSTGGVPVSVFTDYIEVTIELKPAVELHSSRVALYEVSAEEYGKILVDWPAAEVIRRYPSVEGVKHVVEASLKANGGNLAPPFVEWDAVASSLFEEPSTYRLLSQNTVNRGVKSIFIPVLPGTQYHVGAVVTDPSRIRLVVYQHNAARNQIGDAINISSEEGLVITTTGNTHFIRLLVYSYADSRGHYVENVTLVRSSEAVPFRPKESSYLLSRAVLGSIGNIRDILFKQDGRWKVRAAIEKDLVLDGSIAWSPTSDEAGYKIAQTVVGVVPQSNSQIVQGFDGSLLGVVPQGTSLSGRSGELSRLQSNNSLLYITISDTLSGFGEAFIPNANDIKRYFNGWKYSDGVTYTSVTGNGQTATAAQALTNKPTDYTPYKVSYVRTTAQVIDVNDQVEGQLLLTGSTQVDLLGRTSGSTVPGLAAEEVKLTYSKNIRNSVDDTLRAVATNTTALSVHERAIVELYVRVRALEVQG